MTKIEALHTQYRKAVERLTEILRQPKSAIVRDAAIKRFEFTFDLAWKLLKARLEDEKGVSCQSPKDCFREAYRNSFIEYDDFWITMTDWRNQAVHTYGEAFAENLYGKLPETLKRFNQLL